MSSNWFLIQVLKKLRANGSCNWTWTESAECLYATYSASKQLLLISLNEHEVVRLQYDKQDFKWKMRAKVVCNKMLPFIRLSFVAFSAEVFLDISNVKKPTLYRVDRVEFEEILTAKWCRAYICNV